VDEKLDVRQQHVLAAQKGNHIQGSIKRSMTSRSREVILSLCYAPLFCGETSPGVLHPALEPSAQERHGSVGVRSEEVQDDQRDGTPLL